MINRPSTSPPLPPRKSNIHEPFYGLFPKSPQMLEEDTPPQPRVWYYRCNIL